MATASLRSDRRHLVADRDGRHFDHADPRCDAAQTGFGDAALLRCRAGHRRWRRQASDRIVDTWWQTETGGILITPIPGATPLKPGSATRPFFGVEPVIVDGDGKPLDGVAEGNLCLARSWPGQMRTVYGDHKRFVETYFSTFKGLYFTGDGARRDADGFYWITGRVDDVINVAGHRLGTAEIESALVAHPKVAEAAVVGYPHDIKGQGIYAYV